MASRREIKILVDAREVHSHRAGIGRYIYNLFSDLEQAEHSAVFRAVVMGGGEKFLPPLLQEKPLIIPWTNLNRGLKPVWDNLFLLSQFRRGSFDIFYAAGHFAPVIGSEIPLAATIHDLTPFLFPQTFSRLRGGYLRFMMRRITQKAQVIACPSENTARDLERILNVERAKVQVIPPCIFPPEQDSGEAPVEVRGYILALGTLEPRKNLGRLIQAYAVLPDSLRKDHPLVITGRVGWKTGGLPELAREYGIEHQVKFTGFVPEEKLPELFRRAMIFCYPSLYEGFGFPPLEAMYYGTPVLTSNVSSLPEIAGEAALTVDPYSVDDISEGIQRLLNQDDLRKDLTEKGQEQAKLFMNNGFGSKMMAVFEQLAENR